ncbi:L-threonylcarbamoyladenylate synthase [Virgibacillus sp. SK37]|uniref:L-threonylcarbamoyladenylate synthase n=1 Tax=Virgibacillus sp. SK37 TaxID=403957 RepID=UPI0004D17A12|nr:L-threonylcarbamoyladenylate synthase [Virgibacillus sp. SK37]AIF44677.1 tRNA threonylcarbamoyladenosine biosynthesis protein [Virgibacillus sp. SK37]
METKRWNVMNIEKDHTKDMEEAVSILLAGDTVAFPTETVYGLGADATSEKAVAKIFEAKGRPQDNPLIAHVATKEQLQKLVTMVPDYVDKLIDLFAPGPITFVLPSNGVCAENVTAGLSTIGVRMPSHPVAQQLLKACNIPIAAPSANLSGKPSPTSADHVWGDLYGRIAGIVDGGATGVGVESTVIDCTQDIPVVLRPGGITREQLEAAVGTVMVDPALANKDEKPKAPGMKYRHYSPDIDLWLVKGKPGDIDKFINEVRAEGKKVGFMASEHTSHLVKADKIISLGFDAEEIASNLYDALRAFKQGDVDVIVCEAFSEQGIGQAIMNRLKKAASQYIEL